MSSYWEEANALWRRSWEEQERASVRVELEECVESGELSREQAPRREDP